MNGKTRSSFWPDRAYPINFNTKVEHSNPLSANFSKPLKDERVGSSPPCALKNSALLRIRRAIALLPKIFRDGISQSSMPHVLLLFTNSALLTVRVSHRTSELVTSVNQS